MMNIKRIRFDEFGPYRDWSFTTGNNGVQLMYGPNESGKTSLLEGMRTLLFGGTHKAYGPMTGALDVERNGESYYIGRKGKQLDFTVLEILPSMKSLLNIGGMVSIKRHITAFLH